jgi:hypothetical protein
VLSSSSGVFPRNGVSSIILPRKELLAEVLWLLFDQRTPHLYFRGPAGSGKTQFLILLAQELLKLGHAVYFVPDSNVLNDLKSFEFEALNASAAKENKVIFLLIDEISGSMKHAVLLLKNLENIVTIGAGIHRLDSPSPAFETKLEPSFIMLKQHDIADCVIGFKTLIPADHVLDDLRLKYVLECLLQYTGGHLYPFVKLTEHLLSHHTNDCKDDTFMTTLMTLGSESRSVECNLVLQNIINRAYNSIGSAGESLALNVLTGNFSQGDLVRLSHLGYWNMATRKLLSDFLISTLLSKFVLKNNLLSLDTIDFNNASITPTEQAVSLALREMDESDFIDPSVDRLRLENGVSFALGVKLSSIQGLYVCFQSRAKVTGFAGHPPTVDFYLNGRLDAHVEVLLNASKGSFAAHLSKFQKGGAYSHLKNPTLLNIDTTSADRPALPDGPVLTFVKQANSLFRGSQLLKSNVSNKLSAPKRVFSSITRNLLTQIRKLG